MARVLSFLTRYFSNYYTLHRSDLAARAAPLDPRLMYKRILVFRLLTIFFYNQLDLIFKDNYKQQQQNNNNKTTTTKQQQ